MLHIFLVLARACKTGSQLLTVETFRARKEKSLKLATMGGIGTLDK